MYRITRPSLLALAVLSTALIGPGAAHGADRLIFGGKLLIKNPPAGAASNKLIHVGKGPNIAIGAAGSAGDPTCSGAGGGGTSSLRIVTSGGAGEVTIPLPCGGWSTNESNNLYKYKDNTGATCTQVLVKQGALAKAVCKGSQVAIDLNSGMSPVAVDLRLNGDHFCTEFGGEVVQSGANDKTFLRKDASPPTGCPPKLVFLTSAAYDGDLGGLSGADAKCNALAVDAGLLGIYKAWLSDSTASPSTRFTRSDLPYTRVDGTVVANDWADLTDGMLAAPISVTETGATIGASEYVWTDSDEDGTAHGSNCLDWTASSNGEVGIFGDPTKTGVGLGAGWTVSLAAPCNAPLHLYCFEQ